MSLLAIVRHDDMPSGDDTSVVTAATRGDVSAFSILATSYRTKVLKTVRHITGNLDDAEDVTQQALMKAFMNIRGFKGMCSFSSWLTRIAINEALMLKRKHRARLEVGWARSLGNESEAFPEIADVRPNPEQSYGKQESHQLMRTAMNALNPESRLALETCDLNEYSLKDLALMQGSSIGAAKSRLFRSRKLLRAKVKRALRTQAAGRARLSGQLA